MAKKIIFQDSFLVSGIMCYEGCGSSIEAMLTSFFNELKTAKRLPEDANLIIDTEPQSLGVHRLFITIESEESSFIIDEKIIAEFRDNLFGFDVIDNNKFIAKEQANKLNWLNIVVNLLSITAIIILAFVFPPSLGLTIGLTVLSLLTTAFSARQYLLGFLRNLFNKKIANMTTTISLGWLLALAHTLYHTISMPMLASFSMVFMSFIMPIMLITMINGMDLLKSLVLKQASKMQLQGINNLFPQMQDEYLCFISDNFESGNFIKKSLLQKDMYIKVCKNDCFPVDCELIDRETYIDASLLTGESNQRVWPSDTIPAGAINLQQDVIVKALSNSYNSTINQLLFRSNRATESKHSKDPNYFFYLYLALIIISIICAIVIPLALGAFTIPLLLQNTLGILFAVCPCTIAIAHELPKLIGIYQLNQQGIRLRGEHLLKSCDEIKTVVFDKTKTLTTGDSLVESSEGISLALWQRVYLLEKNYGSEHPLALAITKYYEKDMARPIIDTVAEGLRDDKGRGLSALVQGIKVNIGNAEYFKDCHIEMPVESHLVTSKMAQGYSAVFVAENNVYQGVIFIKHEIRKDIVSALLKLKNDGKKIIMLTGDNEQSARGFNQQNGAVFLPDDIHANQTPRQKENFLKDLLEADNSGVCFVGDGLNDAPCARMVTEKGGLSFAMNADDKAAFFTDISLNGKIDYLFVRNKLNWFLKKNIVQNQLLLVYGTLAFLAFIITFSLTGIAVSPFIPMIIMVTTTLFVLFNTYRVKMATNDMLDKRPFFLRSLLASDLSYALLITASTLLISSTLILTITNGALSLPVIVFTAGAITAVSSSFILAAIVLFSLFAIIASAYLLINNFSKQADVSDEAEPISRLGLDPTKPPAVIKPHYLWLMPTSRGLSAGSRDLGREQDPWIPRTSRGT